MLHENENREVKFERVCDAMAYLENEGIADSFNTRDGAVAGFTTRAVDGDIKGVQVAFVYEVVDGVEVEYLEPPEL